MSTRQSQYGTNSMRLKKRTETNSYFKKLSDLNICGRKCHTFGVHTSEHGARCLKEMIKQQACCYCGLNRDEHDNGKEVDSKDWNVDHHTRTRPITEDDVGPMFVRCDMQTSPDAIKTILLDVWEIHPPQLLLSVIGGAKYFKLSDRVEEKFCNAVIHATQQAHAWLLTNGLDAGIVQLVGQTLEKFRLTNLEAAITAIAVVKFGCIANYSNLRNPTTQVSRSRQSGENNIEMHHTHYLLLDDGTKRRYDKIETCMPIIMNAVTKRQDAKEMEVPRVTLVVEGGLDTIKSMFHSLHLNIPVVLIKGSGRVADFFTRWLIYTKDEMEDWTQENEAEQSSTQRVWKYPKSAEAKTTTDSIEFPDTCFITLEPDDDRLSDMFEPFKQLMIDDLQHTLSHRSEELWQNHDKDRLRKRVEDVLPKVMYCLQPAVSSCISSFDLDGEDNLTDTILKSIYDTRKKAIDQYYSEYRRKINNNSTRGKNSNDEIEAIKKAIQDANDNHRDKRMLLNGQVLKLALEWNCLEVAKDLVVRGSIGNITDPKDAIMTTLTNNLPNFLHYFITLNIPLAQLIFEVDQNQIEINASVYNENFIKTLYSNTCIASVCKRAGGLLKTMTELDNYFPKHNESISSTKDLNYVLKQLTEGLVKDMYPTERYSDNHGVRNIVNTEGGKILVFDYPLVNKIFRDLFIWAILVNYIDMAKVLLAHMNHRICAALIARKILKSYRDKYAMYGDKKNEYTQSMKYFEDYAIDCLTLCYRNDPSTACELILRECGIFGKVSCLQVAISADAKRFVGEPCCVQTMWNIWYGQIDRDKTSSKRLMLGIFTLGFSSLYTIYFREIIPMDKQHKPGELPKNCLESYGITYSNRRADQEIWPFSTTKPINIHILSFIQFHQSPFVKFSFAALHYLFLLLLFSYVLLFKFDPSTAETPSIDWTEILLIILISFMLISETRSHWGTHSTTGRESHSITFFQYLTVASYALFYLGLILRFVLTESDGNFSWARIAMGYALQIWWLRALEYLNVLPFLGTNLVTILQMLQDLTFFTCVMAIVMLGYGTSSRSIAYYGNITFTGRDIFGGIIYPVYYLMYSEFVDEFSQLNKAPDENWSIATHILLAFNMLLIVVLLLNLLIALFNKRFEKIQDDAENIWHYLQYLLIRKYFNRPAIVPPFNIIIDFYDFGVILRNWIRKRRNLGVYRQRKVFKMITKHSELIKSWDAFEGASTYEYAHRAVLAKNNTLLETKKSKDIDLRSTSKSNKEIIDNVSKTSINDDVSIEMLNRLQEEIAIVNKTLNYIKTRIDRPDQYLSPAIKERSSLNRFLQN